MLKIEVGGIFKVSVLALWKDCGKNVSKAGSAGSSEQEDLNISSFAEFHRLAT